MIATNSDEPHLQRPKRLRRLRNRHGVVSLWTILVLPVLVVLFAVVVEGVHLWLARVELENGLEAAALAAVKEWAESGASPGLGWTDIPRTIGQEYAAANTINQTQIFIDKNLAPGPYNAANPNENRTCDIDDDGHLIFGAITEEDPYVFEADVVPSCGGEGTVLLDATGEGNLNTGNANNWGVAFLNDDDTDPNLRICRIIITLPGPIGNRNWYFDPLTFAFADNSNNIFANEGACDQNDLVGLDTGTIGVTYAGAAPCNANPGADDFYKSIIFTFPLDGSSDEFAPCDRFRYSIAVRDVNTNNCNATAQGDGDRMGQIGTTATIFFADTGGVCDPERSDQVTFQDNTHRGRVCAGEDSFCSGAADPLDRSHILTPPGIPNLPNGAIQNNQNKDGQSYAFSYGAGSLDYFAVRAQARLQVPSLICGFCGITFGPFQVGACTMAIYDCELQRPRLIRVEPENYFCPSRP